MPNSILHVNTFFLHYDGTHWIFQECKYIENQKTIVMFCLELYQEPSTILDTHLEDYVTKSIATCAIRYSVGHQYKNILISLHFQLAHSKVFHFDLYFLFSPYSRMKFKEKV